ncbi:MAG: Crp/Fnr family transcriptional regulator [Pseudonocardia sp.]|nr:Crp/Fnr family transcriptional regulator [Pseudonocardia sp.]
MPRDGDDGWPRDSLLGLLAETQRATLLAAGTERDFVPGATLLCQGDRTSHVLVVVRGVAKVTSAAENGRETLLALRGPGELIGELAALDAGPRAATVTASGAMATRVVDHGSFTRLLAADPVLALAVTRMVGRRLRAATSRRVELVGLSAPVRLARVLLELAERYGAVTTQGVQLDLLLSQQELANLIGAAEVTVQKILRDLRTSGLVATSRRRVTVTDTAGLRVLAEVW